MQTWAAPGRVNIIGEHTDYNDGFVLPIALPLVVECAARLRPDQRVRVTSRQRPGETVLVAVAELAAQRDRVPGWARYPLGVVAEFVRRGHAVGGVDLVLDGAVPIGAGLSSSAALSCAVAIALRDLFAPAVTDRALIELARAAENDYVGAPTGLLDQSASIMCTAGHALFLDIRGFLADDDANIVAYEQIPFDLDRFGLELLVIDTGQPHELVDGGYAERRAQCEAAATELGVPALRDVAAVADVERLADPVLRRRARHVVTENARVLRVAEELRSGVDPRVIGPLLSAAHASLRDDFEVSTPALDTAVAAARAAGAHGARMVGGGFGGSAIALVDRAHTAAVVDATRKRFADSGFAEPRTFVVGPAAGAHRID
ncbi:galactokinase [Nocardia brasiliensis NBRC 14402]|uniref:galactokinase n=1 Tax=Nocardia brasiliensis TaxID=37326 RepID=UPI0002EF02D4|nr:galactokinase [Nocardia brasiliensis]ASF12106.1 galactokinase [Nocardia brasiliensis]GAJ80083.1 galactokinase [Nocardia brasiliensis NBRC 14402]SUB53005.1 Galactokinase [Nocardia brasiliensis]